MEPTPTEKSQIADFVKDHWEQFGCYPMEVETDNVVYTFDQYWSILEQGLIKWNAKVLSEAQTFTISCAAIGMTYGLSRQEAKNQMIYLVSSIVQLGNETGSIQS